MTMNLTHETPNSVQNCETAKNYLLMKKHSFTKSLKWALLKQKY